MCLQGTKFHEAEVYVQNNSSSDLSNNNNIQKQEVLYPCFI